MIGDLRFRGYSVVPGALDKSACDALKDAAYVAQNGFRVEIDEGRTKRAGEIGVVRAPMWFSPAFYALMTNEAMQMAVEQELSKFAILHLQNLFILPPDKGDRVFQTKFHRDFPRLMGDYRASLNCFFAISEFSGQNGALRVVPGSHQMEKPPDAEYLERYAVPVECAAGSMIVFDSTLWHASGVNTSRMDRVGVNHQFTPPFFKPQVDYVRLLGEEAVLQQTPLVQRLLGWHSRVPASLDEYYQPASQRVYRGGQG